MALGEVVPGRVGRKVGLQNEMPSHVTSSQVKSLGVGHLQLKSPETSNRL